MLNIAKLAFQKLSKICAVLMLLPNPMLYNNGYVLILIINLFILAEKEA